MKLQIPEDGYFGGERWQVPNELFSNKMIDDSDDYEFLGDGAQGLRES